MQHGAVYDPRSDSKGTRFDLSPLEAGARRGPASNNLSENGVGMGPTVALFPDIAHLGSIAWG